MKNPKESFDPYLQEELFHKTDRKKEKKERKLCQRTDRSHYKKSDLDKRHDLIKTGEKTGRVISIKRDLIHVFSETKQILCSLRGSLQKEKKKLKNLVAVGDIVHFSLSSPTEGAIFSVEKRFSTLSRREPLQTKEQILAVNIDQVFITVSVVMPTLKPTLVDRYILAAKKGHMEPIILVNKIDLLDNKSNSDEKALLEEMKKAYQAVGIPLICTSTQTGEGIEKVKELMRDKTSVFSGQSGVGKSSLINATCGLNLKTGQIVEKTYKGSHITSQAELINLPQGGFCIDTPGIKSFGIWDLKKEEIEKYFTEFLPFSNQCKYPNCTHGQEPNCSVKEAVEKGLISSLRFESYRCLIEGLEHEDKKR